jgi:protein ImuB
MTRIVSAWFPHWPMERRARHLKRPEPVKTAELSICATPDERTPFALVTPTVHGLRLTAVTAAAADESLVPGMALADARAAVPHLKTAPADPERDRRALTKLARWMSRYGPRTNIEGDDGLWVDITGAAHLFGGEDTLMRDAHSRLTRFGLTARLGLADTHGAAHVLARAATSPHQPYSIAPPGETRSALAPLPIAALRLDPASVLLLTRLGLKHIGALYDLPRAALALRFRDVADRKATSRRQSEDLAGAALLRLDQALAETAEPRASLVEPPHFIARRAFEAPLISHDGIVATLADLADDLAASLDAAGAGARQIALALYRADGSIAHARIGTSTPCRDPRHITRLLMPKLDEIDAGFGIDVTTLAATRVERLAETQAALTATTSNQAAAALVDRLINRLGPAHVLRLDHRASHLPERAEVLHSAAAHARAPSQLLTAKPPRPPLLLPRPEPITVTAEVPDGAPVQFTWRRVRRRITRAEGPERIAGEWWLTLAAPVPEPQATRDYYRLEDETGAGYWVFRQGLYGHEETGVPPRWFLHGMYG